MNRKEKKAAAEKRRQELTAELLTYLENTLTVENRFNKAKCTVAFDLIPWWVFNKSAKDPQCRSMYLAVAEKVKRLMKDKGHSKIKHIIKWMRNNWQLPKPPKQKEAS